MCYFTLSHQRQCVLLLTLSSAMADECLQSLLEEAWTGGSHGNLSALEEARAWALREVWYEQGQSDYGLCPFVAQRVTKIGGGHPNRHSISKLYEKIDNDEDWFPGKKRNATPGPQPVLSGAKRRKVAKKAMDMKNAGIEPTYSRVLAECGSDVVNPATGRPLDKRAIYNVFRTDCYDEDSGNYWKHMPRLSKSALTEDMRIKRTCFATHVLNWGHTALWFLNHFVWTDICNSILPRSEAKANEQALARKGTRGWISRGCERFSANLKGNKQHVRQASWDTIKVWWIPVLMKGKLHIEVMDPGFPGETPAGASLLVKKLRSAVNKRFQGAVAKPSKVMVDRGRGFYNPGSGQITEQFQCALREYGFTNAMGQNAQIQPGHMQEILLHETAVSWIRWRLAQTVPKECWKETPAEYESRLKRVAADINANLDVEGLCMKLPERLQMLVDSSGDRLKY